MEKKKKRIILIGRSAAGKTTLCQRISHAELKYHKTQTVQIINQINAIRSRNTKPTEPALISVGYIAGGNNFNVVADKVTLGGTVRTFSAQTRAFIEERIKSLAEHTAAASGGTVKINYIKGYPMVENDLDAIAKVEAVASAVLGSENCGERRRKVAPKGPRLSRHQKRSLLHSSRPEIGQTRCDHWRERDEVAPRVVLDATLEHGDAPF